MSAPAFARHVENTAPRTIGTLIDTWQAAKASFDRVDHGDLAGKPIADVLWSGYNSAEFNARQDVLIELAALGIAGDRLKALGDLA